MQLLVNKIFIRNAFRDEETLPPRQIMFRKAWSHSGLKFGILLFASILLIGVFGPFLVTHSPYEQNLTLRLLPPIWMEGGNASHLLGTDGNGRDYLSRLIYGARISVTIGIGAAVVGMIIGVTLGIVSGYFGGWIDQLANYILTCQLALPGLLLAMTLVFLIGPSIAVVSIVIGALHWTLFMVVARSATKRLCQLDFISSSEAIGATKMQIIWRDILPNLLNQIIVIFTLEVGVAILAEASLSFLGVGIQPPTPSWGLLIAEGKEALFFQPWLIILPGLALFCLVIAINMVGDGIRDITDNETEV